jgi:ferredoxin-type protein NapH
MAPMLQMTTVARIFRRALQVLVILLIVIAAKDAAFRQREFRDSRRLQDAYSGAPPSLHEYILKAFPILDTPAENLRGNIWYLDFGIVRIVDSLALLEKGCVSRKLSLSLLLAGSWLMLLSLGLGRVFCSHLCPAAPLFELGTVVRNGLLRVGFNLPQGQLPRFTKYLILGVGLVIASITSHYTLAWSYPPRLFSVELGHVLLDGSIRFGALFLVGILIIEILALPRVWCTHLCPGGALYSILGARRLLRIKRHADRCSQCGKCRPVCPYDLRPDVKSPGMECDNCVRCIAVCPEHALTYKKQKGALSQELNS